MDENSCNHTFEARYDEVKIENVVGTRVLPTYTKIYVHDVCTKCGKVATRTSTFKIEL